MQISRRTARSARRISVAVIAGAVAMTATVPAAQAELRVQKNQRLSTESSPFRSKDQVSLAANPNNPQHIVATNSDYLDQSCEAAASFDGGATWSDPFELQPPAPGIGAPFLPTCRVSNHAGESMFQGVTFGSGQNVYATSVTPRTVAGVEQGASALVYKSTNGGVTWSSAVVSLPGGTGDAVATGPYYELPSVVVDAGAGTNGADLVYSVARDVSGSGNSTSPPCPIARCQAIRVARSLDGGQTFGAPVQASPAGVPAVDGASPTLGQGGSLNITWRTVGTAQGAGLPTIGDIHFTRSADQGQTWSPPVVVTRVTNMARTFNAHTVPLASSSSSFPRMAANRQNGNLYIVYNQGPPGPTAPAGGYQGADHFIPPDSHVYFQRSLDNGGTWSTPKLVNDNTIHPGTQIVQTRHPDVTVAPNGRVDIVWEDRRHWYQGRGERTCLHTHIACDDARLGDTYYSWSTNGGTTFSQDRRISDHSHNNDVGIDYRFATYWTNGPASAPLGSDDLMVGWMDSREGSFDTDNQDIYLAKVQRGASSTVPQEKVDQPNAVNLSLALSQRTYAGGGEGLLASTFATRNGTKVVIVNENDVAGALAGGVLARANLGPVLLSPAGGLPASVQAEVSRLAPAGAFVIGGTGQLSAQVEADLASAGVAAPSIIRLSGAGDAGTAAAIAAAYDRRLPAEVAGALPAFDAAVIANPAGPDAVAAAGLAAARRLPILYVSSGAVPAATTAALASLNINRTLVVGGTSQISSAVMAGLPSPKRLGGADQYATSRAVVEESLSRGLPSNIVYVADGARPMDAALVGFAVGRSTGIMALSPGAVSQTAPATASAADLTGIDRFVVVEATQPAAGGGGGTAPPPPPAPPPTQIVPTKVPRVQIRGLTARVTPTRDRRAPYRYTVSGRIIRPAGIGPLACRRGVVVAQFKTKRGTTLSTRRVTLSPTCTYRIRVTFQNKRRLGSGALKVRVRFLGNARFLPRGPLTRSLRAG